MGLIKGFFNNKDTSIPEWASFFSEDEYYTFISIIDDYFRRELNITYKICDGIITPEKNEYIPMNLGLDNLARMCKQNKIEIYPEIIQNHFNVLIESNKFLVEFRKIEKNLNLVKQYIAARLYDKKYISCLGIESVICKEFSGELFAMLVFDFPKSVLSIEPEQIIPWGKSIDELFELGFNNVRKNYIFNVEKVAFGPDSELIYYCETEHFFASNILIDIENHIEFIGIGGSLVAAPNRNLAIIYPINDLKVLNIINSLCVAVSEMNNNPGSLTKEIYWYQNGKFIPLPYSVETDTIHFSPPEEFVNLINSLG